MADSTPDIQAALDRALARIDELEAENARLRERLQKLEHKLGRNSSNSHRPPSTDDPWEEDSGEKNPGDADGGEDVTGNDKTRQQGAQPGHEGHHRGLLDEDEVDEVVEVKPSQCSSCGTRLCGEDKAPWRHQVFDVEVTRHVTEYQMHRLDCQKCGRSERAALPEGVCQSAFGDSVCGWVSWLGGKFDLSKRDLERLVEQGFGIPISLGSICQLERRMQRALDSAHSEAVEALGDADVLWIDETGWFEQNERRWLWGAVGDEETPVTAFHIDPSRSREALEELVDPNFEGIVSSDRYSAYNGREPGKRQICWQHLVRDFRGLMARDGPGADPARRLLAIARGIFRTTDRIRRGETTSACLRERIDRFWRPATHKILERAAQGEDAPAIFGNLLKREAALWTFAYVDKAEPTNNRAERAVRPGVIKRKLSFGTQSTDGSRFIERMLTVCETLRRQGRSVLDFLVESLRARRTGQTPPTLVPA